MNRKHINKFPIGTLVEYTRPNNPARITYGIVVGHTTLNVKVLLADYSLGCATSGLSENRLRSIQRLYQKPK